MKKILASIALIALALAAVYAGGAGEDSNVQTLEFAIKETGSTLEAYEAIVEAFNEANPDIKVEIVSYGKDYQALMKTKMAANDLPDSLLRKGLSGADEDEDGGK